jgi:hypothetical protein
MESMIPSPVWSIVAGVGLAGWIASACLLAWRGFRPDGSPAGRLPLRWLALLVGFYALWIACTKML